MKFNTISVLCLIGMITIVSAVEINGFRSLKWGDPSSKLSNNSLIEKEKFYTSYKVKNETLDIGSAKVESITYEFFKNRLFRVGIKFQGLQNFIDISSALRMKYDPLIECRTSYNNAQSCEGEDKFGNSIFLNFLYDSSQDSGSITITSNRISKEFDKTMNEEAKKHINGL